MNTQIDSSENSGFLGTGSGIPGASPSVAGNRRIESGRAVHLGRLGGELTVVSGRVWLTRSGDLGDHVLEAGERLRLAVAENAVIEAWDANGAAMVRWNPRHQGFVGAVLAEPLRGLAFLAGRLAAGCASLAGRVAASARWAEGRIDGHSTDSFATPRH